MWDAFWAWLGSLPQGSAAFIGTLTGSSFGLIAILIGALVNASFNRGRDDRIREEDRTALATMLYAELTGMHRTLTENAEHLTNHPPDPTGGFMVPEPAVKFMPEVIDKMGLLRGDTIRLVMDAYVLTEQYMEGLVLVGGRLQTSMPEGRQLVYLDADKASFVIEFNQTRATVVKGAMNALAPYLK
ncbi:hypothetical protein AB7M74_010777 [Bradyrhizobium japonicum]